MMAFEPLFYVALATIALGNGLFLPTLPSQINDLYTAGRSAPRLGLQRLLCRRERRRLPRAADLRDARRDLRLALRLRRGRRRHARRPRHLSFRSAHTCPANRRSRRRSTRDAPRVAPRPRHLPAAARRSASPSPCSAAPMSRSATPSRCGCATTSTARSAASRFGAGHVLLAEPAAGHGDDAAAARALAAAGGARARAFGRSRRWRVGALLVAASYLLVAAVEAMSRRRPRHWLWLL